jgi:Tripartite tricarboxylate transporter family receptor
VPVAAAGPTDVFARLITNKLSEILGKQFYVENIGGAGGNIGVGQAAKTPADGYTILVVSNLFVVNPSLYDRVPYDPYKDFDPVVLAADFTNVITVHPSLPVKTSKISSDSSRLIRANTTTLREGCGGCSPHRTCLSLQFGELQGDFHKMQGGGRRNLAKSHQISIAWNGISLLKRAGKSRENNLCSAGWWRFPVAPRHWRWPARTP